MASLHKCLWLLASNLMVWAADDYNLLHRDGSFEYGYDNPDSFHHSRGNRLNIVQGQFGSRNPSTGAIDTTQYTAGPRGFRPRGKNVVRKYDLNQNGPRPVGSKDDPYFDPSEDPSYNFAFNTRTYSRKEAANRYGDVSGRYTYTDDIGEKHNVEFIAGKNTGFHVKTPFPDSNPRALGPLYFNGRGKPIPRGRTSIQRGLDGSYRFISAGPDQRRTETSDSTGHVRGSYTYLDDKGVQHSVHYIAGPETGYRVLKNVKGPHLPTIFPFGRPEILPPDFYDYLSPGADEIFNTASSGHVKPSKGGGIDTVGSSGANKDEDQFNFGNTSGGDSNLFRPTSNAESGFKPGASKPSGGGSRPPKPSYDDDGTDLDLFGATSSTPAKPFRPSTTYGPSGSNLQPTDSTFPSLGGAGGANSGESTDDGSYKPTGDDGAYRPGQNDFGKPPRPTSDGITRPGRPNYGDGISNDLSNDFNLFDDIGGGFGSTGGSSGSSNFPPKPASTLNPVGGGGAGIGGGPSQSGGVTQGVGAGQGGVGAGQGGVGAGQSGIGAGQGGGGTGGGQYITISGGGSFDEHGTIVTNRGDRLFSVPPGVSVRAHVQAIDLLPLGPRAPTPGDQLKAETRDTGDELNAETSNIHEEISTDDVSDDSNHSTETPSPSNSTETISL